MRDLIDLAIGAAAGFLLVFGPAISDRRHAHQTAQRTASKEPK